MTTRTDPWPPGTPCWVDLSAPDVPAARDFYGNVFGWTFVDTGEEYGHYTLARTRDLNAAAIGPIMAEGQPSAWTVYLASDDVDATAKLVADNGGAIVDGPMDIPGNGRMLIARDACGGTFGVWQAAGMIGAEVANEPGSLTWTDTRLTDPVAGKEFYSAVFGHTYEPVPGAPDDYSVFHVGGEVAGGVGGMTGAPGGTPSHWVPYFSAADVDTAVAAVREGGGAVLMEPADTPFGRMGIVTDPFGAVFALHQPAPS